MSGKKWERFYALAGRYLKVRDLASYDKILLRDLNLMRLMRMMMMMMKGDV